MNDSFEIYEKVEPKKGQIWKKRETWKNEMDFLMACIGSSVGLGNVWRFPFLCYKNGGGAFLIPYFLSVVVGAFPLYFMELIVGQYMSKAGLQAWNMVPLFQGIGLSTTVIAFTFNCYYNVILAWAFYYLFSSFTSELPWEKCSHSWNTPNCSDIWTRNQTGGSENNLTDPVTEFWE